MMRNFLSLIVGAVVLSACSSTGDVETTASVPKSTAKSTYAMDVTDIDYGSVQSDNRFLVSYSFPDDRGRFAVMASTQSGASEPVEDTGEYKSVNDDVASSIICQGEGGLRKLQSKPTYVVADRAYQSTYICNSEG